MRRKEFNDKDETRKTRSVLLVDSIRWLAGFTVLVLWVIVSSSSGIASD